VVDRERIVDGKSIVPGDALIGLPSTGLHTNGYSLARRVFFDVCGLSVNTPVRELRSTVGEALLAEHRSYLRAVEPLLDARLVKGMAHITGGGITENLPRVLPEGCAAEIDRGSWAVPQLFRYIEARGGVPNDDMFRTFNMGIGLIVACADKDRQRVNELLVAAGEQPVAIGRVVAGQRDVRYVGVK